MSATADDPAARARRILGDPTVSVGITHTQERLVPRGIVPDPETGQDDVRVPDLRSYEDLRSRESERTGDPVHHPPHYTRHPAGVECIAIAEEFPFNVGSAIKYLWRAGLKPGADAVENLRKAAWYATREADRLAAKRAV